MTLTHRAIAERVDTADAGACLKMLTMLCPIGPYALVEFEHYIREWPESAQSSLRHAVKCKLLALEVTGRE